MQNTPAGGTAVRTPRKAAAASFLGSMVEYYDFFIFASAAALIFPHVFFPDDGAASQIMSLATFGFAYIARPIGAVVFGHFGDRFGRRNILVITLAMMGLSTVAIGLLPTWDTIGPLAPVLLVVCRLVQGLSAAGEQSGASALSLEHAPEHRRAFFTSWTLSGTQAGQIFATLVFLPVAALPDEQLYTWGWRIPFLASALVVAVAFIVRRTMTEPPGFEEAKASNQTVRFPVVALLKTQWRSVLRVVLCALVSSVSTVFGVLALSAAETVGEIPRSTTLWVVVVANVVALITQPFFAILADRIGRKPVFIYGVLSSGVMVFVYFWAIEQGSVPLIFGTAILLFSFCYAAANANWPSFYAEMFDTRVRFSGMAIGTQLGFVFGGFAPTIITAITGGSKPGGWLTVGIVIGIACLLSAISAMTARETYKVPLRELGRPRSGGLVSDDNRTDSTVAAL